MEPKSFWIFESLSSHSLWSSPVWKFTQIRCFENEGKKEENELILSYTCLFKKYYKYTAFENKCYVTAKEKLIQKNIFNHFPIFQYLGCPPNFTIRIWIIQALSGFTGLIMYIKNNYVFSMQNRLEWFQRIVERIFTILLQNFSHNMMELR